MENRSHRSRKQLKNVQISKKAAAVAETSTIERLQFD